MDSKKKISNISQYIKGIEENHNEKIINKPETLVMEMCNGMVMAHPELELLKNIKSLRRKNERK